MPTLPIERTLGEIILDLLKNDPLSISGITRELKDQGQNIRIRYFSLDLFKKSLFA